MMPTTMAVPVPVIPWSIIVWSVVIVSRLIVVIPWIIIWIVSWSVGEAEGDTRFRRLRSECRQTKSCESNKKKFFHSIVRLAILLGPESLSKKLDDRQRLLLQMIARNRERAELDHN
jgi:hypothetical protein